MRLKVFMIVPLGMIALLGSGCSASREAVTRSSSELWATEVVRDTVREQVIVAVYDTLREVTVVTVDRTEAGDTLRVAQVTDRFRGRDRAAVAEVKEKIVVRTDTVYMAVRDSSFVQNTNGPNNTNRASPVVSSLKWVFWIIVAVIGLVLVLRLGRRGLL